MQEDFGNGRYVRNLFEKAKFEQADRIVKTKYKSKDHISKTDIEKAINSMVVNDKSVRRIGF